MNAEPRQVLLAHEVWATHLLIDACQNLSHEQFHQKFEMGLGSLHDSIVHIIGAMRGWTDVLAHRDIRPRPEGQTFTVPQLQEMLTQAGEELTKFANAYPLDEAVLAVRGGKKYSFVRGGIITHVTTHSMHHRAQCLNMLRHCGVSPLPQSSVMEWMFATGMGSEVK